MEVVALVPDRQHVCSRYRVAQYASHLRAAGLELSLEPLARGAAGRFKQMATPRRDAVVLLVRKLLPLWQIALLRQSSRVLIYDFDDAVFLRDSFHRRGPYSPTRALRFIATVKLADSVLAGNKYLADSACKYTRASKIHVIPTSVDSSRYRPATHVERQPNRLVWIGSSSTLRALEDARPVLEAIGQAIPDTILRVICDQFPRFRNLEVERAVWSSETETEDLRSSDIGISWIPNDSWSRGKCGLKVLQYMAAGLPVVASPVGVHEEMVRHGPGFLPKTPREWVTSVQSLVADHRLRQQMGHEGRRRLESSFHIDTWGPVFADRLREAALR